MRDGFAAMWLQIWTISKVFCSFWARQVIQYLPQYNPVGSTRRWLYSVSFPLQQNGAADTFSFPPLVWLLCLMLHSWLVSPHAQHSGSSGYCNTNNPQVQGFLFPPQWDAFISISHEPSTVRLPLALSTWEHLGSQTLLLIIHCAKLVQSSKFSLCVLQFDFNCGYHYHQRDWGMAAFS